MSNQGARVQILCEDTRHDSFIRKYLRARNYEHRDIYTRPMPTFGSGEQFVRDNFVNAVVFQRDGSSYRTLVVLTDADTLSAKARLNTLLKQLEKGQERKPEERIAIPIPKRNIETWITALNGSEVNEDDDYKRAVKPEDVRPAVNVLVERREANPTPDNAWPLSLKNDYAEELPRLNKQN